MTALLLASPQLERVLAEQGDTAIFNELTGGDDITLPTVPVDVTWDNTVAANGNLALQGDNASIDLAEGGHYLVTYNTWTTESGVDTSDNRRTIESFLDLAGTPLAYGRSYGYMRDANVNIRMYAAGAAIIDANPGDDLRVRTQRVDNNVVGNVALAPSTNGISVLKLSEAWDYLRVRRAANSGDISGNTTFTDVTWDASDEVDTDSFTFTPTSGDITLKGDAGAHFLITTNVQIDQIANSGTRQNYEIQLSLDGAGIDGTKSTAYVRGSPNGSFDSTMVYTGIITKTTSADQTLNVEVRRESVLGVNTIIVGGETGLTIAALPEEADYISLTDSTTQNLSVTQTNFSWNTQNEIDTTSFAHDTTTNNSRIELTRDGDYLFLGAGLTTRTNLGSGARDVPRFDWLVDGGTIAYGGFGSYSRGNQGAADTFSGGSSGGLVLSGLTTGQYVELSHLDEGANDGTVALFAANDAAVQGVEIASLMKEVLVSATGTATSSVTTIPITNVDMGGKLVFRDNANEAHNVNSITLTETGTIDAATSLENIKLFYELDTTAPLNCESENFSGAETQFGATVAAGFSSANGTANFTDAVSVSPTQTMCVYVVYDINENARSGNTIEISINNPDLDISIAGGLAGPYRSVSTASSTILERTEPTQTHYHWSEPFGGFVVSITGSTEDTPAFVAQSTDVILRLDVSNEGAFDTPAMQYRIEWSEKPTATSTCDALTVWTDVDVAADDWEMNDVSSYVNGTDSADENTAIFGAMTDENAVFETPNGAQLDTVSQTGNITLATNNWVELEYGMQATVNSNPGSTYCFRVTDAGTELPVYDVYPEILVSSDITVKSDRTADAAVVAGSTDVDLEASFAIIPDPGIPATNLTSFTLTETGTIDANTHLSNVELFYDEINSAFDCSLFGFAGTEPTFGTASTFTGASSTIAFTDTLAMTADSYCFYVQFDLSGDAPNGDTIDFEITDPTSDLVFSTTLGIVPSSTVSTLGSTTVQGFVREQTHYHWRNDDGSEAAATSATGGTEDTVLTNVEQGQNYRLRVQVSNEGFSDTTGDAYRLEWGLKVSTCDAITAWTDVGETADAFDMFASANLTEGANTTNIAIGIGGVTDENTTLLAANTGVKETSSQVATTTISNTQFTELEFSVQATAFADKGATYCFRVTDAGTELETYTQFAQLQIQPEQDFFVQRGFTTLTTGTTTITAGVDYTAPASSSRSYIRITNSHMTGAGDDNLGGTQNADDVTAYIANPDNLATSIDFVRFGAVSNTRVAWEVVEYIGVPGGDNEIFVRDVGTVTYGTAATTVSGGAVSGILDDADVLPMITGQGNPDTGTADYNTVQSTSDWNSGTDQPELRVVRHQVMQWLCRTQ